jgi:hypothetical protein
MTTPKNKSGHCQICDRYQKIPKGLLAKHGYSREYGFFNGTCHGSDHPPYEHSCDLIPGEIEIVKKMLGNVQAAIAKWEQQTEVCVVRMYRDRMYCYREAVVKSEPYFSVARQEASSILTLHDKESGEQLPDSLWNFETEGEAIQHYNQKYIETVLKMEEKWLKGNLVWLTDRLNNWKYVEIV